MKQQVMFFLIILFVFLIAFIAAPITMDKDYFFWVLITVGLSIVVFLSISDSNLMLKNRVIKHSHLLILSIVIVNFQYPVDFVLGNSLSSDYFIWVNPQVATKCLILSSIGLISFFIGYLALNGSAKKVINTLNVESIYSVGVLKYLSFLLLFIYLYTVNPLYLTGGYAFVEKGSTATYMSLAFNACIVALVIQVSRNFINNNENNSVRLTVYLKKFGFSTLLVILIYLTSVMTSGDRGPIITTVLVFLGGYLSVSGKRYSLISVMILILSASFFISILGIARSFDPELSFVEKIQTAYSSENDSESKSISPFTLELAGSINTLHHVVDFVPDHHDFLYLKFPLEQIIFSIPFSSRIYYSFASELDIKRYADVTTFITWIAQGDNPTYGSGASLLADFYVSAGIFGIILGMLFVGWAMRRFEYVMYARSSTPLFWYVLSIVYFSNTIYLGRASFLSGLQLVVMTLIFIYFNRIFSSKKSINVSSFNDKISINNEPLS